ncbi:MAG TPA: folylpolyglutamate synthase/dihydrofolate synthase family protein [Candidatus Brocadiia bacterium]|nr:folylpolyglutamate synthase/dihydrofolate synthase family protein [Candidatus Brocadiia bacterium]
MTVPVGPAFSSYDDAVAFLMAAIDYEKVVHFKYDSDGFNLRRVEDLMAAVGSPHRGLSCIHVAGTKGKGSVCHMLSAALTACGLKTGLFTSPHLVNLEERIRVNGERISRDAMRERISEIAPYVAGARRDAMAASPTYFEMLTAIAFRHFRAVGVDAAVVEVGLGGRLDSTNVVSPAACGITTIEYDHMDKLGHTLAAIAGEKAGIIKPGVPVVSAPQVPEAMGVIAQAAAERKAPLWAVGKDVFIADGPDGSFSVVTPASRREGLRLECDGGHQRINCAVALGLLDLYASARGLKLPDAAVRAALGSLVIPGRIQVVARNPLTVVDVAHTTGSMSALTEVLGGRRDWRNACFAVGFSGDKDARSMLHVLRRWQSGQSGRRISFCFTKAPSARAAEPETLAAIARECGLSDCEVRPDAAEALAFARVVAGPGDLICCTGSFYLAGRIFELLGVEP